MTLPAGIEKKGRDVRLGANAIALYPSDYSLDFEIQRAPDDGGSPGSPVTIAVVPGDTDVFIDERPLGEAQSHYRIRHVRVGYTESSWTPYIITSPVLIAGASRPAPILPKADEQPSDDGATGTLTVVINDPQNRLSKIEFKSKSGSQDEEAAWSEDASVPYTDTVDLDEKHPSHIRYRIEYYDDVGDAVARERTVPFGLSTKPAKPLVTLTLAANGDVTAHVEADTDTANIRSAGSTSAYPTAGTVDGETPQAGTSVDTGVLVNLDTGDTAFVSVRAYNASAVGSELSKVKLTAISEELNDPPVAITTVVLDMTIDELIVESP